MLLAHLSGKEKIWFSNLITFIVTDDDELENIEQDYLVRYRLEMGVEELDNYLGFEKALDLLAKNSSEMVKKSIMLELCCIVLCDPRFAPSESKNLGLAAQAFGINNLNDYIECAKELVPVQKKAFKLFGEW